MSAFSFDISLGSKYLKSAIHFSNLARDAEQRRIVLRIASN
jgi:hypothetical protein